jgi:hypothetical protein
MACKFCKSTELVDGTLEGVSFVPMRQHRRRLASGVYGIKATVCVECGRISGLTIDVDALRKILRKNSRQ